MNTFNHRIVDRDELLLPDLRGMKDFEGYQKYATYPFVPNAYFTIKSILASSRNLLGETAANVLLNEDHGTFIKILNTLAIDFIHEDSIPPKDIQLSLCVNVLGQILRGRSNNTKTYRKNLRVLLLRMELSTEFNRVVEEHVMDNLRTPNFLKLYRFEPT